MPRGGARPGAGRKPKPRDASGNIVSPVQAERVVQSPEVADIVRDVPRAVVREEGRGKRKSAVEVMSSVMNFLFAKAAEVQPTPANARSNEKKFLDYSLKATTIAAKLAPYQSPTMGAIKFTEEPLDMSKLSDEEVKELARLYQKAAIIPGGDGGATEARIDAEGAGGASIN